LDFSVEFSSCCYRITGTLKDGLLGIFRGARYTGYDKVGAGAARPYVLSRRGSAPSYLGTLHPHGPVVTILASLLLPDRAMSHDQNFKDLLIDHPRQALAFFAAAEAAHIDVRARILPIRQEPLQECLGERFRELDVPLLVEWPDRRRESLLFVLEEESDARRFSIHRLVQYRWSSSCAELARSHNGCV